MGRLTHMLDTDVVIELLRGRDRALDARISSADGLCMSAVTAAELASGASRSARREDAELLVQQLVHAVPVEDFGSAAAGLAGEVRATLARSGTPIGPYDTLIAGHALALGVSLVTRNHREFDRVDGLSVERW